MLSNDLKTIGKSGYLSFPSLVSLGPRDCLELYLFDGLMY